jgi:hypothetical protein
MGGMSWCPRPRCRPYGAGQKSTPIYCSRARSHKHSCAQRYQRLVDLKTTVSRLPSWREHDDQWCRHTNGSHKVGAKPIMAVAPIIKMMIESKAGLSSFMIGVDSEHPSMTLLTKQRIKPERRSHGMSGCAAPQAAPLGFY